LGKNDEITKDKLIKLKHAGISAIPVSVNPFNIEYIPLERIQRVVKIGSQIFYNNLFVYQEIFLGFSLIRTA